MVRMHRGTEEKIGGKTFMPKMKSSRTLAKRIKVTGSGKIKRHHAYMEEALGSKPQ